MPQQNRQLHMAFMAGALVMYTQFTGDICHPALMTQNSGSNEIHP
jgi:hypothetical protein